MTIKIVATQEFLVTVKRPAYLILTFGMPVIALIYVGLIALVAAAAAPAALRTLGQPINVVDESGLLRHAEQLAAASAPATANSQAQTGGGLGLTADRIKSLEAQVRRRPLRRYDNLEKAQEAILAGEAQDVIVVPRNYVETGELVQYTKQWRLLSSGADATFLGQMLGDCVMADAGLTPAQVERTKLRSKVESYEWTSPGGFVLVNKLERGLNTGVPLGIAAILILALLINAGFLSNGIAEEKENKIVEVLLSSVRAEQLLLGKVIGLGAASLLQIAIWLAMAGFFPMLFMLAVRQQVNIDISLVQIAFAVGFFVLGFVFYGSLLLGFGSLGENIKQSQQMSVLIVLLPLMPLFTAIPLMESPNGVFARVLSYVPLFAPSAMMLRLCTGQIAWWDALISLVLLAAGIWLAVWISARLFRIGTLMYGKAPNPLVILRLLFQAS